jgi:hypothetical protein
MNTSQKGNIATSHVLASLIAAGKDVSIPFGDSQRYDLILDDGGRLLRIQCKLGRLINGSICFMTSSSRRKTNKMACGWTSYKGQIDLFGVFCPQNKATYLVPVEVVSERAAYLRIEPPRNNQVKGVRWASDFQLGNKESTTHFEVDSKGVGSTFATPESFS